MSDPRMIGESPSSTESRIPPDTVLASLPESPTARPQPEIGGRDGPEPTRYGDWQFNGKVTDF